MCVSFNSNICKSVILPLDKDSAFQCNICNFWIHIKCNKLNYNDYKYLQGFNDPWYCISCCEEICLFGTLSKKNLLSLANPPPDDSFT